MTPLQTAQLYFDLSNKSDFEGIKELLTDSTIYSSQTTGEYVGADDILVMQKAFHGKFTSVKWNVNSVKETEAGVIVFDYDFIGELPDGDKVTSSGLEQVTVSEGKIERIEIKSKASTRTLSHE
jgi:predicted RNA-binding protein